MTIKVESTTDTQEQVTAANGTKVEEVKPEAAPEAPAETSEKSEATNEQEKKEESAEEADDESEEGESKEEPKKPKKGFKKRIDKLNKRLTESEQKAEYWRQLAMNGQKPQEPKPVEAKVEPISEGKPKQEDFKSHEEWIEAVTDWKIEQRERQAQEKAKEAEAKAQFQTQIERYQQGVEAAREKFDDYDDVIDAASEVTMSVAVRQAILESDNNELAYHLAKDVKEFKRICALPPIAAAREIGKFEAKLLKDQAPEVEAKEIKPSKAPPPITPVGAKGKGSVKDPDEMSYQEFKKWRAKQI